MSITIDLLEADLVAARVRRQPDQRRAGAAAAAPRRAAAAPRAPARVRTIVRRRARPSRSRASAGSRTSRRRRARAARARSPASAAAAASPSCPAPGARANVHRAAERAHARVAPRRCRRRAPRDPSPSRPSRSPAARDEPQQLVVGELRLVGVDEPVALGAREHALAVDAAAVVAHADHDGRAIARRAQRAAGPPRGLPGARRAPPASRCRDRSRCAAGARSDRRSRRASSDRARSPSPRSTNSICLPTERAASRTRRGKRSNTCHTGTMRLVMISSRRSAIESRRLRHRLRRARGSPIVAGELREAAARDHELADEIHQRVEPAQVDAHAALRAARRAVGAAPRRRRRSAGRGARRTAIAPTARRTARVVADPHLGDVARARAARRSTSSASRVGHEPQREVGVESLRLQRVERRVRRRARRRARAAPARRGRRARRAAACPATSRTRTSVPAPAGAGAVHASGDARPARGARRARPRLARRRAVAQRRRPSPRRARRPRASIACSSTSAERKSRSISSRVDRAARRGARGRAASPARATSSATAA